MSEQSLPFPRKIRYFAEYLFVRFFVTLLQKLPISIARTLGENLGRLLYLLTPSRKKIAKDNLAHAFPLISPGKMREVALGSWENLGVGLAEFSQMNCMPSKRFLERFECKGLECLRQSYNQGKGTLLVTAHFGVWEVGTRFWPECGFKTAVVARRVKNPYVDNLVTQIRCGKGTQVILAREAVREAIRFLKAGGLLAILLDHRVMQGGLKVPFFGRPAYTTSLPALLALRYKIPTHLVYCILDGNKFKIHCEPPMDFSDLESNEAGIYQATLRMNAVWESWIKERPELWLWLHNRWKV